MSAAIAAVAAALLADRGHAAIAVLVLPAGAQAGIMLAEAIGPDRVFAHTIWAAPDAEPAIAAAPHIELLETDEDVEEPRIGLWPGGVVSDRRRLRRIDTLYGDDPRTVALIALCHPAEPMQVLAGAARVLHRDRPDLLIDLRDLPPLDRPPRTAALAACLGGRALRDLGDGLFCASDSARPLPRLQPSSPRAVPFDDRLACAGLHPPEFDAPDGGRWTGSGVVIRVTLPRPPPGAWMLRLAVADWGNAPTGFPAVIDAATYPAHVTAESLCYGPAAIRPGGEVIRIRLLAPRPTADLVRWPRRIGLRLRSATWEPAA